MSTFEDQESKVAIPLLEELLKDKSHVIRIGAIRILGTVGNASHLPILEKISNSDKNENVRNRASQAISKLTNIHRET